MARIAAITIILSTSVLMAESTIYDVDVYQNCNDSAKYVRQSFVATADSITRIEVFIGRSPGVGTYSFDILEIPGVEADTNAPTTGWRWIGRNLQQPAKVIKGKTYTLEVKHEQSPDVYTNYYYDPTNPYPNGEMDAQTPGWDLVARA